MQQRNRPMRTVAWRALTALTGVLLLSACGMYPDELANREASQLTHGGDPEVGREKIREYGCGTCHTVPGVRGARGQVGPPLTGIARRMYIAGLLPNNPENLMHWIRDPTSVDPKTAMPDVGVTSDDARHIAAYLYSLR